MLLLDDEDPGGMPGWVDFKGFLGRDSIPGEEGPSGPKGMGKMPNAYVGKNPWIGCIKSKGNNRQSILKMFKTDINVNAHCLFFSTWG